MSSLSTTPSPARSDLTPVPARTAGPARPFTVHGTVLTVGALTWAASLLIFGNDPQDAVGRAGFAVGSGIFQVGLLLLLRVLRRTGAIGTGRVARTLLIIETVVVGLAICSTTADGIMISDLTAPAWLLLDLTWPLSMLGMFAIGITIAIKGRWHGVSRFWPLVAESWAVVTIPALGAFGPTVGSIVGAVHLIVGYAVLGRIVARKPEPAA